MKWTALLFDLENPLPARILEEKRLLLESIPGIQTVRLMTDRRGALPSFSNVIRYQGRRWRCEVDQLNGVIQATSDLLSGPALWLNACYPHIRMETLQRAMQCESSAVSVSTRKMAVHRFFTFKREGYSIGPDSPQPVQGNVMIAKEYDEKAQVVWSRTMRPEEFDVPGEWEHREWGTLSSAENGDSHGNFEIFGKWRYNEGTWSWINTESGEHEIRGRHDFPSIASVRDAFACGRAGEFQFAEAKSIELSGEEGDRLNSAIDVIAFSR